MFVPFCSAPPDRRSAIPHSRCTHSSLLCQILVRIPCPPILDPAVAAMAFEAADILVLVVLLVWQCLSTCPENQNQWIFGHVLPTQDMVESMLSSAFLLFAPGLFEVIQASTPPNIAFFKTLPANFSKRWGIYALVLEKQGCRPKIYIGSGTGCNGGVSRRLAQYNTKVNVPRYVAMALEDGYVIFHKGLFLVLG